MADPRYDMSSEAHSENRVGRPSRALAKVAVAVSRRDRLRRTLEASFSSSLTRRIVTLNLGGLVVLVLGFLWLNHFRADIIEAQVAEPEDAGRHHSRRHCGLRRG